MKACHFISCIISPTLNLLLFAPLSQSVFAYQPMIESAQDDQFAVARKHLLSHQEALTRLVNYALDDSDVDKAFLSAQGKLKTAFTNESAHLGNAEKDKERESERQKLRKLLKDAKVQAFEKKEQKLFIPYSTSYSNGNTLFSSMLYSPEKIDLTEDCKSFNRRKSFTICIWPIKGNWYMYYDWSYFPKKKGLQVKH